MKKKRRRKSRNGSTHLTDKLLLPLALLGAVQTVTGRVRTSFTTRHLHTTTTSTTTRGQEEEVGMVGQE